MSIANNRREIFRKNPKDITNDIAIGISYPFDNRVFNSTYTTKDQLRSNLINFERYKYMFFSLNRGIY
jgi:hypothetical protein